jgi:hypothetical protein
VIHGNGNNSGSGAGDPAEYGAVCQIHADGGVRLDGCIAGQIGGRLVGTQQSHGMFCRPVHEIQERRGLEAVVHVSFIGWLTYSERNFLP